VVAVLWNAVPPRGNGVAVALAERTSTPPACGTTCGPGAPGPNGTGCWAPSTGDASDRAPICRCAHDTPRWTGRPLPAGRSDHRALSLAGRREATTVLDDSLLAGAADRQEPTAASAPGRTEVENVGYRTTYR